MAQGWIAFAGKGPLLLRLIRDRRARYVAAGTAVFGANLVFARYLFAISWFVGSPVGRNLGNIIAAELTMMVAFFLHSRFTWAETRVSFFRGLISFHIVSMAGLVARSVVFAALDGLEVPPMLAVIASIGVAILLNFVGYDALVFRSRSVPQP